MRWHKSGADEASLLNDLESCRKLAAGSAARMGAIGLPPPTDPRFGAASGPTQAEQRLQERQRADGCMRAKGYTLVPVDK